MIQITPQMRVLLAVEPVDFRKGIDGLVQLCRQKLQADPLAGALFVFSSRGRKSLKLLVYDGYGNIEIMGHSLLERGCFHGNQRFGERGCSHNSEQGGD
jgi:transposase